MKVSFNFHKLGKTQHELDRDFNQKHDERIGDKKFRNKVKLWTSFYRANIHRLAIDYLGLQLFTFQIILLYMMDIVPNFMFWGGRGIGKSWLIAVYACCRAILYPHSKIVIASGTKSQASLIITQKIGLELMKKSPALRREIKNITANSSKALVEFYNGSYIEAVVQTNNARGMRATLLILDEFRMISKENRDKVLMPFLSTYRTPPYMLKPEYKHLKREENKSVMLSSAYFKHHWSYDSFKSFIKNMCTDLSEFTCALSIDIAIEHGLTSEERIALMKKADDYDPISYMMEYECMFFGSSANAFYDFHQIVKNRKLEKAFYPLTTDQYLSWKNKRTRPYPMMKGEVRLLSVDVALMGGSRNDNTIITLIRLLPNGNEYRMQVPFIESLNGVHSEDQAIRIKQLFHDFDCNEIVLDTQGNGMSIYDNLVKSGLYDKERDIEYEAFTAFNNDEMRKRATTQDALPVIYAIKQTPQFNHNMAVNLRDVLQRGKIELLVDEFNGREYLIDHFDNYNKLNAVQKSDLQISYYQTSSLLNELINLEYTVNGAYIKVKEVGRNRKDRYSSLAFGVVRAKELEENLGEKTDFDYSKLVFF